MTEEQKRRDKLAVVAQMAATLQAGDRAATDGHILTAREYAERALLLYEAVDALLGEHNR